MEEYIVISKDYLERIKQVADDKKMDGVSCAIGIAIAKAIPAEDVFNAGREEVIDEDYENKDCWRYSTYSDFITSLKPKA